MCDINASHLIHTRHFYVRDIHTCESFSCVSHVWCVTRHLRYTRDTSFICVSHSCVWCCESLTLTWCVWLTSCVWCCESLHTLTHMKGLTTGDVVCECVRLKEVMLRVPSYTHTHQETHNITYCVCVCECVRLMCVCVCDSYHVCNVVSPSMSVSVWDWHESEVCVKLICGSGVCVRERSHCATRLSHNCTNASIYTCI